MVGYVRDSLAEESWSVQFIVAAASVGCTGSQSVGATAGWVGGMMVDLLVIELWSGVGYLRLLQQLMSFRLCWRRCCTWQRCYRGPDMMPWLPPSSDCGLWKHWHVYTAAFEEYRTHFAELLSSCMHLVGLFDSSMAFSRGLRRLA